MRDVIKYLLLKLNQLIYNNNDFEMDYDVQDKE
jgi:hypothetical protein